MCTLCTIVGEEAKEVGRSNYEGGGYVVLEDTTAGGTRPGRKSCSLSAPPVFGDRKPGRTIVPLRKFSRPTSLGTML